MSDAKTHRCGCFDPRQASLVVSFTLLLLYGLASLALLVDLATNQLQLVGGRSDLEASEAVTLGALLASLAGAALLGRAVTSGAPRLLLAWLAWHGTCWVLAALTAVAVAVLSAVRDSVSPLVLGVGAVMQAVALALMAYCGLIVLRYYRLLADIQLRAASEDTTKEKAGGGPAWTVQQQQPGPGSPAPLPPV